MSRILLILFSILLVVTAQVVLKVGANAIARLASDERRNPLRLGLATLRIPAVVAGLLIYAVAAVAWILVLSTTPLSYAYPFLGLAYVGVVLASVLILRERFSPIQWAGLVFVLFGVLTVATS